MKRIISLLLVIMLVGVGLVACSKDDVPDDTGATEAVSTSVEDTNDFPNIEKQDNGGQKFNILYPNWSLYENYYLAEKTNGEAINDVNYERQLAINEHLGIEIVAVPVSAEGGQDAIHVLSSRLQTAALSGEDSYQLALTHCYVGVLGRGLDGSLADFGEIECLNLEADYWRGDSMKSITMEGKMFFGTGSFILYDPTVILFNKDMVNEYPDLSAENLYQNVRDKIWTIDMLMAYAQNVSSDENEYVADGEGKYGFSCQMNWELSGFMASSNYFTVSSDADGKYIATPYSQKIDDLYLKVKSLIDADYTYHWNYSATSEEIGMNVMREGRTMFLASGLSPAMKIIANSDVKIGILPYPSMESGQEMKNLDWAGFMVIPSSVKNLELSGAVAELLCYYGDKLVYPAFYDVLLGTRTAENLADAEMLDLIFNSLVTDPGLTFIESSGYMYHLFYMFSELAAKGSIEVSSFFAQNATRASMKLDFTK